MSLYEKLWEPGPHKCRSGRFLHFLFFIVSVLRRGHSGVSPVPWSSASTSERLWVSTFRQGRGKDFKIGPAFRREEKGLACEGVVTPSLCPSGELH